MKNRETQSQYPSASRAGISTNHSVCVFKGSNDGESGNEHSLDYILTAEEFASLNLVKPQSVRARLCRTGSYFGVRPRKLSNGRLAFPNVQVM